MTWNYSEKTTQLFKDAVHGKAGTHMGEIEDPDGLGEHGSLSCGDALRFTFRVRKDPDDPTRDVITAARYLTFGCTSAIAASEALCAIIEEREHTPIEALEITNEDIIEYLEGLPEAKIHCSVMGAEALEASVFNWAQNRGVDLEELGVEVAETGEDGGRIVCKCFSVTEPYLRRKINELGLKTIPEITAAIKAGGACMSCHHAPGGLQDILDEELGRKAKPEDATAEPEAARKEPEEVSPYKLGKEIEDAFEQYIRPMLQRDGGDIEIIDIKGFKVFCRMKGACANCAGAQMTLKMMVEQTLKDRVNEHIRVVAVK